LTTINKKTWCLEKEKEALGGVRTKEACPSFSNKITAYYTFLLSSFHSELVGSLVFASSLDTCDPCWRGTVECLIQIDRLLSATGGGSRSGGSTTLGTHSLAPVVAVSTMLSEGSGQETYMKVLEKKEMPIIKAQLGMTEKP
jgi:hypothetical protein